MKATQTCLTGLQLFVTALCTEAPREGCSSGVTEILDLAHQNQTTTTNCYSLVSYFTVNITNIVS